MRTEKQIQLLREQKGNELAAKSEKLDSIAAKFDDSVNWFPNIKFKVSNNKTANAIKSKKPRRLAGCWEVRGHFRHYQNGKVVYIKPYEKGENRAKRIKKQYTL